MAQIPYRANLSAATFPIAFEKAGRTVINPGVDQTFDRRVDPTGNTPKDIGIPQAIYMENVLPTYNGYQSIGLFSAQDLTIAAGNTVNHVLKLTVVSAALGVPEEWIIKIYNASTTIRYSAGLNGAENTLVVAGFGLAGLASFSPLSAVYVQGRSFIYDGSQLWEITNPAGILVFTNVTGIVTGLIFGLIVKFCSAFNYLIAIDVTGRVSWSSLTNSLDFTVSLVSGAGFETPGAMRSPVVTAIEHPQGVLIYTQTNVIACRYTGNRAYPWRFTEIENSGGIFHHFTATGSTNSSVQFCRTTSGAIQAVDMNKAEIIIPDVSDYLQKTRTYTVWTAPGFNIAGFPTNSYEYSGAVEQAQQLSCRLSVVQDRYLVISYGRSITVNLAQASALASVYDFAFVYDIVLRRLGRIKIPHTQCEESDGNIYFLTGYSSTLFATDAQKAWRLYTDLLMQNLGGDTPYYHRGILAIGKMQFMRQLNLVLEGVDVEITQPNPTFADGSTARFNILDAVTYDGKNFSHPSLPIFHSLYKKSFSGYLRKYLAHIEAVNHTIVFDGAFDLVSVVCTFSLGGKPLE